MKQKFIQTIPLILCFSGIGIWYFGFQCVLVKCFVSSIVWAHSLTLIKPIGLFSLAALPPTLILPFLKKELFQSWTRFALVWIIFSLIWVFVTPVTWEDLGGDWGIQFIPSPVRSDVADFTGLAFTAISLVIIVWKTIALRVQKSRSLPR